MAEHKVQPSTMLLFIDTTGVGDNYDAVVCLKSITKNHSVNTIDANSWCGIKKIPGVIETSYNFEGLQLEDPAADTLSSTSLISLLLSKTKIAYKIGPETPITGDTTETGLGYITEISSSYSFDSFGSFSGTIESYGIPTITVE
jgi:hypothetical protein